MSGSKSLGAVILVSWLASVLAIDRANHGSYIPMETFQLGEYFFTFYTQRANWDEAFTICRATHARLAVVHTSARADFLAQSLAETQMSFEDMWIGGRFMKDKWVWVPTGRDVPTVKDGKGFPPWVEFPTQRGKNCLALDRRNHDKPIFVELHCQLSRPFICEKSVIDAIDNYPQQGLSSVLRGNRYITYHARVTWDEALAFCRQSGAMLAVIDDWRVANFLVGLMRRARPELESVWVGGQFMFNEWIWLSSNTNFPNTSQPNGFPPWMYNSSRPGVGKDCLLFDHHACRHDTPKYHRNKNMCEEPVFIDTECDKEKNFICETIPEDKRAAAYNSTYLGITYFFSNHPMTWTKASEDCSRRNMTLAVVDNPRKLKFIVTMMGELQEEWDHAWLGGTYEPESKVWTWQATNATIPGPNFITMKRHEATTSTFGLIEIPETDVFPPWCTNELVYDDESACLNLDRGDHSIPIWYGLNCDLEQGYVCQTEDLSLAKENQHNAPSLYSLIPVGLTFKQAEVACKKNSSYVSIVNDINEAKQMAERIPLGQMVWVGGKREGQHWKWVMTGQNIPDLAGSDGYPPWEKLTTELGSQCLAMKVGINEWPVFVEHPCKSELMTICEFPPKEYSQPKLTTHFDGLKYTFYDNATTWYRALETCAVADSQLIQIRTPIVAKMLLSSSDAFTDMWISGHFLKDEWEWATTGEQIEAFNTTGDGFPPWPTGSSPQQEGAKGACLSFSMEVDNPLFLGSNCTELKRFVCGQKIGDTSPDDNAYEKDVRVGSKVYLMSTVKQNNGKTKALCAMRGKLMASIVTLEKAAALFNASREFTSVWVHATVDANKTWYLGPDNLTETDIPFLINNNNKDAKCLTLTIDRYNSTISFRPRKCLKHAMMVCESEQISLKMRKIEIKKIKYGVKETAVVADSGGSAGAAVAVATAVKTTGGSVDTVLPNEDKLMAVQEQAWCEAMSYCQNIGGHLTSGIYKIDEAIKFVRNLDQDVGSNLWTGIHQSGRNWVFEDTKDPVDLTQLPEWKDGVTPQLNPATPEKMCITIDRSNPDVLTIEALECSLRLPSICIEDLRKCPALYNDYGIEWLTPECIAGGSLGKGTVCRAKCTTASDIMIGPERVTCEGGRWWGINKNDMPTCVALESAHKSVKEAMDSSTDSSGSREVGMVYVVDASNTNSKKDVECLRTFVKNMVGVYPLGNVRSAALITYANHAKIINDNDTNTCYLLNEVLNMHTHKDDGRNFEAALLAAEKVSGGMMSTGKGSVVIFITTGLDRGSSNRMAVADRIKKRGASIMTIGIGNYSRNQLEELASTGRKKKLQMFGFNTFEEFKTSSLKFRSYFRRERVSDCI